MIMIIVIIVIIDDTFYNGIDRTSLLTESTIDTLSHVNIVPGGPPTAIGSRFSFNSDGSSRTGLGT